MGCLKFLHDELVSVGVHRQGRSPSDTASSSLGDDTVSVGVRRQNRSPPKTGVESLDDDTVSVGGRKQNRSPPNTAMASLDDDVVSVGVRRQSRRPPDTATSSFLFEKQLFFFLLLVRAIVPTFSVQIRLGFATEESGGRMFKLC